MTLNKGGGGWGGGVGGLVLLALPAFLPSLIYSFFIREGRGPPGSSSKSAADNLYLNNKIICSRFLYVIVNSSCMRPR